MNRSSTGKVGKQQRSRAAKPKYVRKPSSASAPRWQRADTLVRASVNDGIQELLGLMDAKEEKESKTAPPNEEPVIFVAPQPEPASKDPIVHQIANSHSMLEEVEESMLSFAPYSTASPPDTPRFHPLESSPIARDTLHSATMLPTSDEIAEAQQIHEQLKAEGFRVPELPETCTDLVPISPEVKLQPIETVKGYKNSGRPPSHMKTQGAHIPVFNKASWWAAPALKAVTVCVSTAAALPLIRHPWAFVIAGAVMFIPVSYAIRLGLKWWVSGSVSNSRYSPPDHYEWTKAVTVTSAMALVRTDPQVNRQSTIIDYITRPFDLVLQNIAVAAGAAASVETARIINVARCCTRPSDHDYRPSYALTSKADPRLVPMNISIHESRHTDRANIMVWCPEVTSTVRSFTDLALDINRETLSFEKAKNVTPALHLDAAFAAEIAASSALVAHIESHNLDHRRQDVLDSMGLNSRARQDFRNMLLDTALTTASLFALNLLAVALYGASRLSSLPPHVRLRSA